MLNLNRKSPSGLSPSSGSYSEIRALPGSRIKVRSSSYVLSRLGLMSLCHLCMGSKVGCEALIAASHACQKVSLYCSQIDGEKIDTGSMELDAGLSAVQFQFSFAIWIVTCCLPYPFLISVLRL